MASASRTFKYSGNQHDDTRRWGSATYLESATLIRQLRQRVSGLLVILIGLAGLGHEGAHVIAARPAQEQSARTGHQSMAATLYLYCDKLYSSSLTTAPPVLHRRACCTRRWRETAARSPCSWSTGTPRGSRQTCGASSRASYSQRRTIHIWRIVASG